MIDKQEIERRAVLWEQGYWEVPDGLDTSDFDFDWRPLKFDRPYIHQFGTQWQRTGGPRFVIPDNEGIKYQSHMSAKRLPDRSMFTVVVDDYDVEFDWSWHPDDTEPAFIWTFGNQYRDSYEMPTVEYRVSGAVERKHSTSLTAMLVGKKEFWNELIPIENHGWNRSWCPDLYEPPFIYVWGNQWNEAATEPTVEYRMPGATEYKYMADFTPRVKSNPDNWQVLIPIDPDSFDFSWRPNPHEPPFIYVWGNQWNEAATEPTVEYRMPGATEYKYMADFTPRVKSNPDNWQVLIPIDPDSFDFSWRPNPHEPPFIYVWGNQWNEAATEPTVEYRMPGATEYKYMADFTPRVKSNPDNWQVLIPIDPDSFDFSWRPNPHEPPFIYVWGNQWNEAATEPTVEYRMPEATEYKYMTEQVCKVLPDMTNWTVPDNQWNYKFDFSWRPNPFSPPQIYQWQSGGPIYTVEHATDIVLMEIDTGYNHNDTIGQTPIYWIETTLKDLIELHPGEMFWALNRDLDYRNFDFTWRPGAENFTHINVFGNKLSKDTGTYYINSPAYLAGHREINYVEDHEVDIVTDIDMFYIVRGNKSSMDRYQELLQRYPRLQKTRYLNSWVDTVSRCLRKANSRYVWILSSEVDYSSFKFDYYPASWNRDKVHVFGTQWSHWGNTYLINRETFDEDTKYIKTIEHLPNIYHVRGKNTVLTDYLFDILYIDHGDNSSTLEHLKTVVDSNRITVIPYRNNYLDSLADWFATIPNYAIQHEQLTWVCSSYCDYSEFDFSWTPDPFMRKRIHRFANIRNQQKEKMGDTFLVDLSEFRLQHTGISRLEDYPHGVNYITYLSVPIISDLGRHHHDNLKINTR